MKQFKDTKVAKILKKRWAGKDMETYFIEKNKEFITRLKTEVKTEVKNKYEKFNIWKKIQ
jgi:hypothetical protein